MKNAIMIGVSVLMNVKQDYVVSFLDDLPKSRQTNKGDNYGICMVGIFMGIFCFINVYIFPILVLPK